MAKKAKKAGQQKVPKFDRDILLTILGVVAVVAIATLVVLFIQALGEQQQQVATEQIAAPAIQEGQFANRGVSSRQEAYKNSR